MRENKDFDGKGLPYSIKSPSDPVSIAMNLDKESALESISSIILKALDGKDHEIGIADREDGDEYESNSFWYDEDGWGVELIYSLCGEYVVEEQTYWQPGDEYFTKVWGYIDDLTVTYEDPETGESFEYSDNELNELKEKVLEFILDSIHVY